MVSPKKPFTYSVRGINEIIEEKDNKFTSLRQIAWGVGPDEELGDHKIVLDLRKYSIDPSNGEEKLLKGITFMTEEGPSELAHCLLRNNYGDTKECLRILSSRENFKHAVETINDNEEEEEITFDLRSLL